MPSLLTNINSWASQHLPAQQKRRLRAARDVLSRWSGQSLQDLALLYHTDKCDWHSYIEHYETHFRPFRNRRINLLEIGVGGYDDPAAGGASLRMWKAWFKIAQIHGIDIHDKRPHDEGRIRTYQGSQTDENFLEGVLSRIGAVHLIIDDGSHINAHVVQTFNFLFPRLASGGLYVVEDTQTSYWPDYGGTSDDLNASHTMMNRLKQLADSLNHREWSKAPPDAFQSTVRGVHFYHNIVFIEKA